MSYAYEEVIKQASISSYGGNDTENFFSLKETSDCGYIAAGYTYSSDLSYVNKGGYDALIVKFDKNDNIEWARNYGGSAIDYFYNAIETFNGGFVAVGYSKSSNAGFANKGGSDAIIIKYDKNGNQLWENSFGGDSNDEYNEVAELPDGSLVVVGYSESSDAGFIAKGDADAIIVKYNSSGKQLWFKSLGGNNLDVFNSVKISQGDIFVVGSSSSTDLSIPNIGDRDSLVCRYDANGNLIWIKSFGGEKFDGFYRLIEDSSGNFVTTGWSSSFHDSDNVKGLMAKFDRNGNFTWHTVWGGSMNNYFRDIVETVNGYVVVGYSHSKDNEFTSVASVDGKKAFANSVIQ
jgi:hypothetical protein